MKNLLLLSLFSILCFFSCNGKDPGQNVRIVCHRGFWKSAAVPNAQNSIASLSQAQSNTYWGSEFDLHLTADGEIIVNHDPKIGSLPIHTTPYAVLAQQRLANGEKPSTLDEYLNQGALSSTKLVLELKPQDTHEKGIELAQKSIGKLREHQLLDPDRIMFISFDLGICAYIARELPQFCNQYLEGDKTPEELHEMGINGIDYHYMVFALHPDYVKRCHDLGMTVNVWTVDSLHQMKKLVAMGVDAITTNQPDTLRKLLGEREIQAGN